ncbi:MAG: hypothetical protein HY720_15360 [Planctomycetes bacterium]|nr:hypothetical protein [Planctomycetota bacterium]
MAAATSWAKCAANDPGETADILAARVRSGSRYTRFLLDLATKGELASRKLASVLKALGLANDPRPPDPQSPDFAAIRVLRNSFDRAWAIFADRTRPARDRDKARHETIAAADALSRLEASLPRAERGGDFARTLYDRRYDASEYDWQVSLYSRRMSVYRFSMREDNVMQSATSRSGKAHARSANRTWVRRKNLRLDQRKIDLARKILGTRTETDTIERALDLVAFQEEAGAGFARVAGRGGFIAVFEDDREP